MKTVKRWNISLINSQTFKNFSSSVCIPKGSLKWWWGWVLQHDHQNQTISLSFGFYWIQQIVYKFTNIVVEVSFATWSSKQNDKFWVLQNTTYHLHQIHQNCGKEFSRCDYQNETLSFGFFRIRHIICTKFTKIIVSSCNVTIKTKTFKFWVLKQS